MQPCCQRSLTPDVASRCCVQGSQAATSVRACMAASEQSQKWNDRSQSRGCTHALGRFLPVVVVSSRPKQTCRPRVSCPSIELCAALFNRCRRDEHSEDRWGTISQSDHAARG